MTSKFILGYSCLSCIFIIVLLEIHVIRTSLLYNYFQLHRYFCFYSSLLQTSAANVLLSAYFAWILLCFSLLRDRAFFKRWEFCYIVVTFFLFYESLLTFSCPLSCSSLIILCSVLITGFNEKGYKIFYPPLTSWALMLSLQTPLLGYIYRPHFNSEYIPYEIIPCTAHSFLIYYWINVNNPLMYMCCLSYLKCFSMFRNFLYIARFVQFLYFILIHFV